MHGKEQTLVAETARIKEIYEKDVNNIDDVYATLDSQPKVNEPKLTKGMIPIKWNGDQTVETTSKDLEWYNYEDTSIKGKDNSSKWANVKTVDGSMWVWIPRFAYKINYKNEDRKELGGTIDIVFIQGTGNKDFKGHDVTDNHYIDKSGKTGAYTIHPAFKDGTNSNFANGEWKKEISGFWVAKFEAGYKGNVNEPNSAQDSKVKLTVLAPSDSGTVYNTNYYGTREIGENIKYPIFRRE